MAFQKALTLVVITALLAQAGGFQAGATTSAPSAVQPVVEDLKVLILEGAGATNNVQTRQATPPVVEVHDANGRPVEGAEVVFRLPASGPSGSFANNQLTQTVKTNYQGQATVTGYAPNTQTGRFTINVTATLGSRMGQATIPQTNSAKVFAARAPERRRGIKKKWIIIGAVAAAAGIAAGILLTRDSGPHKVVLVPGGVGVGGPR